MKKYLLVRPGSIPDEIRALHGDFDQWFVDASGLDRAAFDVVDPTRGEHSAGDADRYRGVLVTGSLAAAFSGEPWIAPLEASIRRWADRRVPLLGVCFGAQVIATALGGRVVRNPRGKEVGTVRIELNAAGRGSSFFQGFPAEFRAQSSHEDCIDRLPDGAELLASSSLAEVQAYRLGPSVHAVQFHPEIRPETMRDLIRREVESGDMPRATGLELAEAVEPTPEARGLLPRFFAPAQAAVPIG